MLQQATHQKDTFRTKKELTLKLCDIIFYAYWTCKVGQPFYTIFQTFQHLVDGLFFDYHTDGFYVWDLTKWSITMRFYHPARKLHKNTHIQCLHVIVASLPC